MIKGETKSGFKFTAPEGLGKDILFMKTVKAFYRAADKGDSDEMVDKALDLPVQILGTSREEERLYKHLKKLHGRVLYDDLFDELKEIIAIIMREDGTVKNS